MKISDARGHKNKGDWLASVVLRSKLTFGKTDNEVRSKILAEIFRGIKGRNLGDGIILLPGGYFNSGVKRADAKIPYYAKNIGEMIRQSNRDIIVCFGIDGLTGRGYPKNFPKDQLAIAVNKEGIVAIGRKFYPTEDEKKKINFAETYQSLEGVYPRIFSFKGRRFYLAVCYDIFGIKKGIEKQELPNPGVDVILNTIHQFTPRCKCKGDCECGAASGDVLFTRHGLAGASNQWKCPVFASVVFFNRDISEKWPSGVYWDKGNTRKFKYGNNPIKPKDIFCVCVNGEEDASVRIYNLNWRKKR